MDELIADLQLFSSVLAKLGYTSSATEVDMVTSDLLMNAQEKLADGTTIKPHQRKALLIKAKARVDGIPVYVRASLKPRKAPSPMDKPGRPTRLEHDLLPSGTLALSWKCKQPRGAKGTMYQVYRALGIDGEPVFLGTTGKKKFTDATLPAGVRTVCYRIVAVRSTARGEMAEFLVNLGVSGKVPAQFLPRDQYNAAAA